MHVFCFFCLPATPNKDVFCSDLVWGFMKTMIWPVDVTMGVCTATNTVDASEIWINPVPYHLIWKSPHFVPWNFILLSGDDCQISEASTDTTCYPRCPRRMPCALAEVLELSTSKPEISAPRQGPVTSYNQSYGAPISRVRTTQFRPFLLAIFRPFTGVITAVLTPNMALCK